MSASSSSSSSSPSSPAPMLTASLDPLWYEADPGKRLPVFGVKDVPLLELRDAVADLHARAVAGPFRQLAPMGTARAVVAQKCVDVPIKDRPAIEQRLRWVLADDERLLLLCKGSYRFGDDKERYLLAVTEGRALLVDSDDLKRGRATVAELPVDAHLTRTIKDGQERLEIDHAGKHGVLTTRSNESVVYEALNALKCRVGAEAESPALREDA